MPPYWRTFIEEHCLVGREIMVPVEGDLSGLGVEIEILDEPGILYEQTELYPGIVVHKDGFIPIGGCGIGTGDPYFINERDGEGGPLYRIYHDEVNESGCDPATAVVMVLKDYRELLKYSDSAPPTTPTGGTR